MSHGKAQHTAPKEGETDEQCAMAVQSLETLSLEPSCSGTVQSLTQPNALEIKEEGVEILPEDEPQYLPLGISTICRAKHVPCMQDSDTNIPRQHEFLCSSREPPRNTMMPLSGVPKPWVAQRKPMKCAETGCRSTELVSEYANHLEVHHAALPIKRIALHTCQTFFLNPRMAARDNATFAAMFLLHSTDVKVGSGPYKHCLPLVVMMSLIAVADIGADKDAVGASGDGPDLLAIWVAGIDPGEYPLSVTLSLFKRAGKLPIYNQTNSFPVHDISDGHKNIYKRKGCVLLNEMHLDFLAQEGDTLLEVQFEVHL